MIARLLQRAGERNPLPEGTLAVGAGLLVGGLTAYGYLVVSGRVLGPARYASLSALWFLGFVAGPGCFLPLEQEVGRALAARRARGIGGGPVIRRAALAGGSLAAVLVVASLAASGPLMSDLFDRDALLLVGFLLVLVGYFAAHLTRGSLAGNGRFGPYGVLLGAEGTVRLLGCVALAVAGADRAGPYGLFIGIAPLAAVLIALRGQHGLVNPGPDSPWSELSSALGYLLAGAVLAQLLVNAAPLAVKVLATPSEQKIAGRFIAGVVVARIPVFLFQAVQAALLPKLAHLAGAGRLADFRRGLRRLVDAMAGLGVIATVAAVAVGPFALRILFGAEFQLTRRDLGYLAVGSVIYMLALILAQALIALKGHALAAAGWVVGVVTFVVVTAMGSDLLLRVELAYVAGSTASALAMAGLLVSRLRATGDAPIEEALVPLGSEFVEP